MHGYIAPTLQCDDCMWQISTGENAAQMAYNIDVPKTSVAEALEILVDSVVNPKFLTWEVKEAVEKMKGDLQTVKDNPQTLLMEVGLCLPHKLSGRCIADCPCHVWALLGACAEVPCLSFQQLRYGALQSSNMC